MLRNLKVNEKHMLRDRGYMLDDTDIVLYGREGTVEYVVEVKTGRGFNPADMGLCLRDLFKKGGGKHEVAN